MGGTSVLLVFAVQVCLVAAVRLWGIGTDSTDVLYSINPTNGELTKLAQEKYDWENGAFNPVPATYDPIGKNIYYASTNYILSFNVEKKIANPMITFGSAFGINGIFWDPTTLNIFGIISYDNINQLVAYPANGNPPIMILPQIQIPFYTTAFDPTNRILYFINTFYYNQTFSVASMRLNDLGNYTEYISYSACDGYEITFIAYDTVLHQLVGMVGNRTEGSTMYAFTIQNGVCTRDGPIYTSSIDGALVVTAVYDSETAKLYINMMTLNPWFVVYDFKNKKTTTMPQDDLLQWMALDYE